MVTLSAPVSMYPFEFVPLELIARLPVHYTGAVLVPLGFSKRRRTWPFHVVACCLKEEGYKIYKDI